jgi:hypothetical protein
LWSGIFNRVRLAWVMPRRVKTFLLVGEGWEAFLKVQLCGRWFRHAFCVVFGGKEMIQVLKNSRGQRWKLRLLKILFIYFFFVFILFSLFKKKKKINKQEKERCLGCFMV